MKNLYAIPVLLFCLNTLGFGQSQRLVMLEEFTSSTCGPCVSANSKIHGWLTANPTTFTAVFYHMSWPSPGNDPMYLANTIDNNARRSYYNINSVPHSHVDGNAWSGSGNNLQWSSISNRAAVPSPFEISMQHTLSAAQDEIALIMVAKATQPVTGSLKAHNVVIEKHVQFTTPPGSNGETSFDHVMKKMLPSKDGTNLTSFEPGDYVIIETSWPFEASQVYDIDELMGVGFIQNNLTKEVHQAANSTTNPVTLPYNIDLQILGISNVSVTNCSGVVTPYVTVRNNGNEDVTAFALHCQVNGGSVVTENWSGSLSPLEKIIVELPAYSFAPMANNNLVVYSSNPNGSADEYPKNDTLDFPIVSAEATSLTLYLFVKTDDNPEETTWDVKDDQGVVVQAGGPYSTPGIIHRDTIDIPSEGCYTFTIYDAGGQGLCCSHGNGLYLLQDNLGTEIVQGGNFADYELTEFNASLVSARSQFDKGRALQVYPNPTGSNTTASIYLVYNEYIDINLYNAFGQKIMAVFTGVLSAGEHQVNMDVSQVTPGMYYLRMTTGDNLYTRKIMITR